MSIVGELLQRWRLRTDSRPGVPAPGHQDAPPAGEAATTTPGAAPAQTAEVADQVCRLCRRPLCDDDVVAVCADDVVHSDCYDESLGDAPR